jgi:hypothetical protein
MRLERNIEQTFSEERITEESLSQQEDPARVWRGVSIIARTPSTGNDYHNFRGVIHHAHFEAQ